MRIQSGESRHPNHQVGYKRAQSGCRVRRSVSTGPLLAPAPLSTVVGSNETSKRVYSVAYTLVITRLTD